MADKKFSLVAVLKTDIANFKKGMAESQQALSNFSKSGSGIPAGLKMIGGAVVAAFALDKVKDFTTECATLAGQAQGVKEAFAKIDNGNLLASLKEATRGTVDELTLMQNAVKADKFRIPLDQLATYLKFATNTAAETGQSVDYLVDSIITGLGRESPLILDNLGISAKALSDKVKEVGNFGKAAGIIISEMMAKSGDVTLTAAQITERWKSQFKDAKTELGTYLIPLISKLGSATSQTIPNIVSGFKEIINSIISTYNEFIDLYNESTAFRVVVESIKVAIKGTFETAVMIIKDFGALLVLLKDLVIAAFSPSQSMSEAWTKFQTKITENWKNSAESVGKALESAINNVKTGGAEKKQLFGDSGNNGLFTKNSTNAAKEQISLIDSIKNKIKELQDQLATETDLNRIAALNTKIKQLNDELTTTQNLSNTKIAGVSNANLIKQLDALKSTQPEIKLKVSTNAESLEKTRQEMIKWVDELNQSIESGISDMITSISESIGESLASGDWSNFFSNIYVQLGNFAKQIGKLFIAYGVASSAFLKALKYPPAAIAAGIALVAIGSAVSAAASKGFKSGGIVEGYGYQDSVTALLTPGEMVLNNRQQNRLFKMINTGAGNNGAVVIGGELRLKGGDLVAALKYQNTKKSNM